MPRRAPGRQFPVPTGLAARMILTLVSSTVVNAVFGLVLLFLLVVVVVGAGFGAAMGLGMAAGLVANLLLDPLAPLWSALGGALGGGIAALVGSLAPIWRAGDRVLDLLSPVTAAVEDAAGDLLVVLSDVCAVLEAVFVVDPSLVVAGAGVVVIAFVIPVSVGPDMLVRDLDAQVVDADEEPRFVETLRGIALQAGVRTPRAAVVESAVPRSFAAGRRGNGTVVVTRGLLDALDDDQLAAVLAHEVSHLANRDATVICYAAFYPLFFAFTDRFEDEGGENDQGESGSVEETDPAEQGMENTELLAHLVPVSFISLADRGGVVGAVGTLLRILDLGLLYTISMPIGIAYISAKYAVYVVVFVVLILSWPLLAVAQHLGGMLAAYLSRHREYTADRGAVAITGDPSSLASALWVLDVADPPETDLRAVEAVEPLSVLPLEQRNPEGLIGRLRFRTHPPTEDRIERLRGMARRQETGARAPDL